MQCANHPEVHARWVCVQCERPACGDCVKQIKARQTTLAACAACGGRVRATADRESSDTEPEPLSALMRRAWSGEVLITAAAIATPLLLLPVAGLASVVLEFIYWGAVFGYYFAVIDHMARGEEGLPDAPDTLSSGSGLLNQLMKVISVTFMVLAPAVVWSVVNARSLSDMPTQAPGLLALLAVLGVAFIPAAIVAITFDGRLGVAMMPWVWIQVITRKPAAYGALVVRFAAAGAAWAACTWGVALTLGWVPWVGVWLVGAANAIFAVSQAVVVGAYLRASSDEFGYS